MLQAEKLIAALDAAGALEASDVPSSAKQKSKAESQACRFAMWKTSLIPSLL